MEGCCMASWCGCSTGRWEVVPNLPEDFHLVRRDKEVELWTARDFKAGEIRTARPWSAAGNRIALRILAVFLGIIGRCAIRGHGLARCTCSSKHEGLSAHGSAQCRQPMTS